VRDKEARRIIGVVEDFNFLSLKERMDALVISSSKDWRQVLVKLKPGQMDAGIGQIGKLYRQLVPAFPFSYRFLDRNFQELYQKDLRQQTILVIFAALAIFVACLGLFGLASFTATKRVKEIGVRKVLGASVQSIVMLLSRDLLKPVLIATLIALPVGYWAMDHWLRAFAYQTPLSAWIFGLAACISLCIALVTVGLKAVAAASANPVRSLKAE
jgi:putative ABC transport system permease protein